mgnify:CR=1 FL=1
MPSGPNNAPVVYRSPSRLERRLRQGNFVVVAEVKPPDSADLSGFVGSVEVLRGFADTIELTDMPLAMPHVANIAPGALLAQAGFDVMLNVTCRDRNLIAQQGYLLAAAALGIYNVLCVTGDHPGYGDHPYARPVSEQDALGLLHLARKLRDEGTYESGRPLIVPPALFLGAAASPDAPPIEERPLHTARKVEAGADFIETQPIFDVSAFSRYMARLRDLGVTERAFVIAGIVAVPSVEMAEYLHCIPGIRAPESLADRLRRVPASKRDDEGMRIACETIEAIRAIDGVHGVLIYPLDRPPEYMARLIDMAGLVAIAG